MIYLVQSIGPDGELGVGLETEVQIIQILDMQDCHEQHIEVYDVSEYGKISKLKVFGVWHNQDNPLYIKVENEEGTIIFDGYGTDH